MEYLSPIGLDEAFNALGSGMPSIVAGGTDWYPAQGERPIRCDILDITRIEGLRGIVRGPNGWRIGAASTWSDIVRADLPHAFDALKAAAREVGSVQIQNAGTIAGNICNASPAADGVPPLLALNAAVEIGSSAGRRTLPLGEFIRGVRCMALEAGEMVTAILIPEIENTRRSAFVKLGARRYLVISIAMVAVALDIENGVIRNPAVAVGACSPVAARLPILEAALDGAALDHVAGIVAAADLSALSPIDDVRGSGAYRLDVASSLIERAVMEAAHG